MTQRSGIGVIPGGEGTERLLGFAALTANLRVGGHRRLAVSAANP